MDNNCLRCHYFKVEDTSTGLCRLAKGKDAPRPRKNHEDSCQEWRDSGQQYYIRLGWLKGQQQQN